MQTPSSRIIWLLSLYLALSTPALFAKSTYGFELEAVRLHFSKDKQIYASYTVPCGSRFAGFLYRAGQAGELKVAAVAQRDHARCLGLKAFHNVKLPLLSADRFAAVSSLNPSDEPQVLSALALDNIHSERSSRGEGVHAIYTSQCGEALGMLVMNNSQGLSFGVLESSLSKDRRATCNRSSKVYSVMGLDVSPIKNPGFIGTNPERTSAPSYTLRRVPVRLLKPRASSTKPSQMHERYFHVSYLRACDEAPIGIVRKERGSVLEISMLVAHFPSMSCGAPEAERTWTSWEEGLFLNKKQTLKTLARMDTVPLRIIRPSSYQVSPRNGSKLVVNTFSSCQRDVGLISRSSPQGLAVGVLQTATVEPCNSRLKKVSYPLPMDPSSPARRDIKPLQLVGQR